MEPVAYMTKEGYVYGKHSTRPIEADIPLYTKPFFSQKPIAMMVKIDGFDKPEFTTTCSSAALKHPNYTALYDHPPIAWAELEEGQSIPLYEHPETVEDRESAIYATGYWNGIQKAKEKNETLDTRSYLIGRYDGLRELNGEEIDNIFGISALNTTVTLTTEQCYWIVDAILRKASVNK
jgi:acyl-CoA synthetase (NDP forming)